MRLGPGLVFLGLFELGVRLLEVLFDHDLTESVARVSDLSDLDVLLDTALFHLLVGRFDIAHGVEPRIARQGRDETDIRTLRGLNRADPAIVGGMDIADFEARALARQSAGAERRQTAFVGDLGERVGLIHEL